MLDEEMDDMIRRAAKQHLPSYDNKAWDKMEQLLDKHLPQGRDRKGFVFYLLLSLLIGGGLFVGGYYFMGNEKATVATIDPARSAQKASIASTVPENSVAPIQNSSSAVNASDNADHDVNSKVDANTVKQSAQTFTNQFTTGRSGAKTSVNIIPGNTAVDESTNAASASNPNQFPQSSNSSFNKGVATIINAAADKMNVVADVNKNDIENKEDVQPVLKKPADADIIKDIAQEKAVETVKTKTASTEKKNSKHSIASNFGLSFSVGPDISYVEFNKPGKVTVSYGVGLSYTFFKKLTLQTGFYVSKKIYSSDSSDYHAPASFWSYYPNMQNTVDANCRVYEIPVNLLYNFGKKGNHNWFGGAGLSSLFMKHETYDYSYKYAGQTYPKSYSLDNENQHNFSVLTLMGGYQYQLSPRVSVSAEPYFKLPLTGIGFGKVQLKSGGALLNVTVKPFAKRDKK